MAAVVLVGIDEAGRGPVFGPLVVAGVAGLDQDAFRALGVKDSKLLTAKRRTELEEQVRRVAARVATVVVSPDMIDGRSGSVNLNTLEVDAFARIAKRLAGSRLFVDAADVDAARFGASILRRVGRASTYEKVVSEHRADVNHPIVSAASIVAKVKRDRLLRAMARPLEKEMGLPLGSGYSHDEVTVRFLEAYRMRFGRFPVGTRRSWDTVKVMESRLLTRRLEDFLGAAARPMGLPSR